MVVCSSILGWKIPWTEDPGGLQSMGLQRVGHDRGTNTKHSAVTEPLAAAVTDLQHTLERTSGWRAGMKHSVLLEKLEE